MSSDNIYKIKPLEYKWSSDDLTMNVGFTAQEIDDILKDTMTTYTTGAQGSPSYTISTAAGSNGTSWNYSNITANPISAVATASGNQLHVKGDTVIEGDLKVDGVSFKETIETINKRLSILVPDPEKLKQFESLRRAYEHYKTLEALCELPKKENK